MASIYADEDFDRRVVVELRSLGHDVLTVQEAGWGDRGVEDSEVLVFATTSGRAVLTFNRRDFYPPSPNLKPPPRHRGLLQGSQLPDLGHAD